MAKTKITALTELTDTNIAIGDLIPIVDISDTSQAASGTTKKVTITSLATAVASAFSGDSPTFVNLTTTGTTTLGDASGDAVTINAATITLANDTNFVLSGGVNGVSFDTDVLSIDATNDRVGIGTVSPATKLQIETSAGDGFKFSEGSDGGGYYGEFIVDGDGLKLGTTSGVRDVQFRVGSATKMIIDTAGNVGIGTTTITTGILEVKSTNEYTACINTWNSSGSNDNQFVYFYTDSGRTARGLINFNRSAGLVQYLTTSDYRAKNIIGKFEANNIIDDLKVWNGRMNEATIERPMFIAHEVQEIIPYAVSGIKDAETYQQIDHQIFVPLIVAELQSLRKRVKELENV